MIARLVENAQNDTSIKVIFFHGGTFFSSGADLSVFMKLGHVSKDVLREMSSLHTEHWMTDLLIQVKNSVKPVVGLVRG